MPSTREILDLADGWLLALTGHVFDLLTLTKPVSPDAAVNLSRVVSKLSPLLGNLIEFNAVEFLNRQDVFQGLGEWRRQDPGFPDAVFVGEGIDPLPGIEIKAWFPLATEITARFRESQAHFQFDQTDVCLLAWLPERLIYGRPKIVDVCLVSGRSVAEARDTHYHNPPGYIVLEPEDTTARTVNLQQTNANGYKWQGSKAQMIEARRLVASWGNSAAVYSVAPGYQNLLRDLAARFPYRLDTNFAKLDRIGHAGIENFKDRVLARPYCGLTIVDWARLFSSGKDSAIRSALAQHLEVLADGFAEVVR